MLYTVLKPPAGILVRRIWNPLVVGRENIPAAGPVILASNHEGLAETVMMPAMMRRQVRFLAKADLFRGGSPLNRVFARLLLGLKIMPIDRTGGAAASSAIDAGSAVLRRGEVLGIYPEGTRSPDGRMYRGKTGMARIALATDAPIVPVAVTGSYEAQRGRRFIPRRRPRIRIEFLPPVHVGELLEEHDGGNGAAPLRVVTDAVMERIRAVTGQERVDAYAADIKKALRAAAGDGS